MKKIAFTPDDLADVYAKRWMCRDMINSFLRNLRPVKLPGVGHPKFRRAVGAEHSVNFGGKDEG